MKPPEENFAMQLIEFFNVEVRFTAKSFLFHKLYRIIVALFNVPVYYIFVQSGPSGPSNSKTRLSVYLSCLSVCLPSICIIV